MHDKQIFLRTFFVVSLFFIFPYANIWASSVSCEFFISNSGKVIMVDGKDRRASVVIKARLSSPERSMFDFGYMSGDSYIPITGRVRDLHAHTFMGNDIVDFALRNKGPDHLFGTSDDFIYRLSDSAKYANQHYFLPIKSRNSKKTQTYFQILRLDWDVNFDGHPDVYTFLKIKGSKYDGMMPAPTAVPLLPAVWFFGSGLLGLALTLSRGDKTLSR